MPPARRILVTLYTGYIRTMIQQRKLETPKCFVSQLDSRLAWPLVGPVNTWTISNIVKGVKSEKYSISNLFILHYITRRTAMFRYCRFEVLSICCWDREKIFNFYLGSKNHLQICSVDIRFSWDKNARLSELEWVSSAAFIVKAFFMHTTISQTWLSFSNKRHKRKGSRKHDIPC